MTIDDQPSAIRYPRGTGLGVDVLNSKFGYNMKELGTSGRPVKIGKGRVVRQKKSSSGKRQVFKSAAFFISYHLRTKLRDGPEMMTAPATCLRVSLPFLELFLLKLL